MNNTALNQRISYHQALSEIPRIDLDKRFIGKTIWEANNTRIGDGELMTAMITRVSHNYIETKAKFQPAPPPKKKKNVFA